MPSALWVFIAADGSEWIPIWNVFGSMDARIVISFLRDTGVSPDLGSVMLFDAISGKRLTMVSDVPVMSGMRLAVPFVDVNDFLRRPMHYASVLTGVDERLHSIKSSISMCLVKNMNRQCTRMRNELAKAASSLQECNALVDQFPSEILQRLPAIGSIALPATLKHGHHQTGGGGGGGVSNHSVLDVVETSRREFPSLQHDCTADLDTFEIEAKNYSDTLSNTSKVDDAVRLTEHFRRRSSDAFLRWRERLQWLEIFCKQMLDTKRVVQQLRPTALERAPHIHREEQLEREKAELASEKLLLQAQRAQLERERAQSEEQVVLERAKLEQQKAQLEQHKAQLEAHKAQLEQQQERHKAQIEQQVEAHKAQLEQQVEAHKAQLEQQTAQQEAHKAQLEQQLEAHTAQLEQQTAQRHKAQIEQQKAQIEQQTAQRQKAQIEQLSQRGIIGQLSQRIHFILSRSDVARNDPVDVPMDRVPLFVGDSISLQFEEETTTMSNRNVVVQANIALRFEQQLTPSKDRPTSANGGADDDKTLPFNITIRDGNVESVLRRELLGKILPFRWSDTVNEWISRYPVEHPIPPFEKGQSVPLTLDPVYAPSHEANRRGDASEEILLSIVEVRPATYSMAVVTGASLG